MEKNKRMKWAENGAAFVFSGFLMFFFLVNSALHPWVNGTITTDSAVFQVVTHRMLEGGMPYRDSFDHKGPLLYLLDGLGIRLGGSTGIWMIELIFLTCTFWVLYKMARLVCSVFSAFVCTAAAGTLLFEFFDGGNMTEEYAMLFITVSLYIFVDFFLHKRLSRLRLVICGMSMGFVLYLRPNMIGLWVVLCITAAIFCILQKDGKKWISMSLFFLSGLMLVLIPVLIWLTVKGCLPYFYEAYIDFNFKYTAAFAGEDIWTARLGALTYFGCRSVFLLAVLSSFCIGEEASALEISYPFLLFSNLFLVSMAGKNFEHYGMILIPLVVFPIANLLGKLEKQKRHRIRTLMPPILGLLLLVFLIGPDWCALAIQMPQIYSERKESHIDPEAAQIVGIIRENTQKEDLITVYGNWDWIYLASDRSHATRYSYQYSIAKVVPAYRDLYFEELEKECPKVLVIQGIRKDDRIVHFAKEHGYECVWSSEDKKPSLVYVRKEAAEEEQ